jgi:BlaI family transcriptional regulator, penicillinase repressor
VSNADSNPLTAAQREIMEIVWARGQVTVAEVRTALAASRAVARNTVQTMMGRLEERGWLTHRQIGRTFMYRAATPKEESIGRKVREVVNTLCDGSPETLVAALLEYRGLRPGELDRIRKMLDEAKGGRLKKG